jgi:uncharacterized protein (DUF2252 family)
MSLAVSPEEDTGIGMITSTTAFVPPKERMATGHSLRSQVSRKSHGEWKRPKDRADPIAILQKSDEGRIPELLPIRYGRMRESPFAFLRGAAAIMAADLAHTPITGVRVQACGDCHIMNFGAFASPERNLIFDINDFDETLPAPWEWDIKRLVTSIELARRSVGGRRKDREAAIRAAASSYRRHMAGYAQMSALEVWYERIDLKELIESDPDWSRRKRDQALIDEARKKIIPAHLLPSMTPKKVGGDTELFKIKDQPPLVTHLQKHRSPSYFERVEKVFKETYRESLAIPYRTLLDRYRLRDIALKVVGIGSVGTFCEVALFTDAQDAPLFLQIKEARNSALEPYAGPSVFSTNGERVVVGQRLMQAASDIFLGWMVGLEPKRHFYVRQLRDMKIPMPLDPARPVDFAYFSAACGWALARAHARTGDPAVLDGYLGSSDAFDDAMVQFSQAYADQTERDHAALLKAIEAGRIEAESSSA